MILGLNAYTYCSGAALYDGEVRLVLEEERLNREKKTKAFPRMALEAAALEPGDVECVAFPWDPAKLLWEEAKVLGAGLPRSLQMLRPAADPEGSAALPLFAWTRLPLDVRRHFGGRRPPIRFVGHHRAHACLAFFGSPFEESIVLVADGYGDDCSLSAWLARGTRIELLWRNSFAHSLGLLYGAVTSHLGYRACHDEGKVMALAALGGDGMLADFREIVQLDEAGGPPRLDFSYLNYHRAGELDPFTRKFKDRFGEERGRGERLEPRHADLAAALQWTLEEALLDIARRLRERHGIPNLALAGGVALNCAANGRLARESGFDAIYVPPNPDDGGTPLGAAMLVHLCVNGHPRAEPILHSAFGLEYGAADVGRAAAGHGARPVADPAEAAAALLAEGRTVGWFQGRMEMGPRALGQRSILADPRPPGMKDHLNADVKHREPYRPYAPSVLEEELGAWFPDSPPSPFMSFASSVAADRADQVPAVLHVDGTARVQSVTAAAAPLYHRMIRAFARRTGVPMVLNTSLNDQEPICCSPADAVRMFESTNLDALIVEDALLTAPGVRQPEEEHAGAPA